MQRTGLPVRAKTMLEMCCSVNTCSAQEPPSRLHIAQSRRTPRRGVRDNKYTHTCYQCTHSTAQHAHKVRCSTTSSSCCPRRTTYMPTHRHMWQQILCNRMSLRVSQKYIIRHPGDSNPCGQSPMDIESFSLTARTQCLVVKARYKRLCPQDVVGSATAALRCPPMCPALRDTFFALMRRRHAHGHIHKRTHKQLDCSERT